ncbi:MAG: thioredoxin-dependent thiol peroxidase [Pyrinomonadaceae bacterium]|nr:thioredoxin-dependent thiol peroxidase [Pyrinomonadaceae bacterium]
MVKEGNKAPAFTAKDQEGNKVKLSDYKGEKVVLYFYPRDMTPGCTKQACSLRDGFSELKKNNIVVLGVSTDDEKSHQKFIAKHELPFTLIADTDHKVSEKYGVWVEKNMYGKKYMGIKRTTFLINEDGKIATIMKKVKVAEHAQEVLDAFN